MNDIAKSHWVTDNGNVRLSMPIMKVDKERRTVSGFATLDNIDKQGDIVPLEASLKAFERFRGNIREMHQPIAVGKIVAFKADKFFDAETAKSYNGVSVSAYISKGAQSTWEKVLDGTLSGFSIGGAILDDEEAYDEKMDSTVRIIKDYELVELSLVDNPANQFANIISIEKLDDGSIHLDSILKGGLENVFWCDSDSILRTVATEQTACPICDKRMQNIGFVEANDDDKAATIKALFDRFRKDEELGDVESSQTAIAEPIADNIEKEANIVADETVESVTEEVAEEIVEKSDEAAEEAPVSEEDIAKSEETPEATAPAVASDDVDLAKAVDEIKNSVTTAVSELGETVKGYLNDLAEITKSVDALKEELASLKGEVEKFDGRVEAVEADTAVRKSGDLGGVTEVKEENIEKSIWAGAFLSSADLYR